jgi:hypothetical protein
MTYIRPEATYGLSKLLVKERQTTLCQELEEYQLGLHDFTTQCKNWSYSYIESACHLIP